MTILFLIAMIVLNVLSSQPIIDWWISAIFESLSMICCACVIISVLTKEMNVW